MCFTWLQNRIPVFSIFSIHNSQHNHNVNEIQLVKWSHAHTHTSHSLFANIHTIELIRLRFATRLGYFVMMRNIQRSGDFWENKNFPCYLIALWVFFIMFVSMGIYHKELQPHLFAKISGGTRWINADNHNNRIID